MLPAGTGPWREADAVVQLAQVRQAKTERAAEIVLGLTVDMQRSGAAFLVIAITLVALVALVAEVGERLGTQAAAARGVTQFSEGLLAVCLIVTFGAVVKTAGRPCYENESTCIAEGDCRSVSAE
ncbi:hypothetical protein AZH11_22540 [Pseudomonas simiae]|nr:hypothetical protein AZH11_22540 [Pseudomonas simiae]